MVDVPTPLNNWWARKNSNLRPMDYESTALFLSGPKKSDKFNTFKHLNSALACPEWTERDRKETEKRQKRTQLRYV